MDSVIRASRLALGRTVLAIPGHTGAGTATVGATATPDKTIERDAGGGGFDANALRRSIEQEMRLQWQTHERETLAKDREAARREGRELGLTQGLAEARTAGEAAARDAESAARREQAERNDRVEAVLQAMQREHAAALAAIHNEVGLLAFEAICRIVGARAVSREFVLGIVETVCRGAQASSAATLRLHPRDVQLLGADANRLSLSGGTVLGIAPDDSLELGGCRVETSAGQFDGSLATQLERLQALLCAGSHPGQAEEASA